MSALLVGWLAWCLPVNPVFSFVLSRLQLVAVKRTLGAAGASLTNVIQFEDVTEAERKTAHSAGLTLISIAELIEMVGPPLVSSPCPYSCSCFGSVLSCWC